jgi:glycosyltransferase involved in cell wall biosynthesis
MLWTGHPKSAIKEFKRHLTISGWLPERSQSMVFIGDAYRTLGNDIEACQWWHRAYVENSDRREPLIRLANYYYEKADPKRVIAYCEALLTIPWTPFYANFADHYRQIPHDMLAWAYWTVGDKKKSQENWEKALDYQPLNQKFCESVELYLPYVPKVSIIIPTLGREEKLKRLLEEIPKTACYKNYEVIVEQDNFTNRLGVPKSVRNGVAKSSGELVMYLGNDCVPRMGFLAQAVWKMFKSFPEFDGLVGMNDEYWHGEFATHWLASKKLLPYLDGEFFHTGYYHNGCDNELTERCKMIGKYVWAENARVYHEHPINPNFKEPQDEVHKIVQDKERLEIDTALLRDRSKLLGFKLHENFTHPSIKLSVVVPVKDKLEMTERMLKSLRENTPSLGQVILVDDWSKEDFTKLDAEYHKNSRIGVCSAWNTGAKYAKFPYIAFLNNDTLFTPNWEKPLIETLNNEVWVTSPYSTTGKDFFVNPHPNMDGQKTGISFLGSCFVMTRDVWDKVGPIDSRLNIWCGDNYIYESVTQDFGRRCEEIPSSVIHHFCSQTIDRTKIEDNLTEDKRTFDLIYGERNWGNEKIYPWVPSEIDLRLRLPVKNLHKLKVLNIGVGDMSSGLARQLPYFKWGQLDNIDTHQPYIDYAKTLPWIGTVSFMLKDMRDIKNWNDYDLVMVFDVFEHLKKEESIKIIKEIKTHLIIFGPLEDKPRHNHYDVEGQEHLSLWTEQDFKDLGLNTEVLPSFHSDEEGNRWDAIWAINF